MGMTIDDATKIVKKMLAYTDLTARANMNKDMVDACHVLIELAENYEQRLKADKVTMLTEIQLEIDEKCSCNRHIEHEDSWNVGLEQARDLIQQKINALRGGENDSN